MQVEQTAWSWNHSEVEAESDEQAKELAEDLFETEWPEHATSEMETTILAVDGIPYPSWKERQIMNEPKTDSSTAQSKTPELKIELGNVRALLYLTETERNGKFYTVSFERTYADKDGNERTAYSFRQSDIERLVEVAQAAKQEMARLTPTKTQDREPELRIIR